MIWIKLYLLNLVAHHHSFLSHAVLYLYISSFWQLYQYGARDSCLRDRFKSRDDENHLRFWNSYLPSHLNGEEKLKSWDTFWVLTKYKIILKYTTKIVLLFFFKIQNIRISNAFLICVDNAFSVLPNSQEESIRKQIMNSVFI